MEREGFVGLLLSQARVLAALGKDAGEEERIREEVGAWMPERGRLRFKGECWVGQKA